jgi:hypothetical protein
MRPSIRPADHPHDDELTPDEVERISIESAALEVPRRHCEIPAAKAREGRG